MTTKQLIRGEEATQHIVQDMLEGLVLTTPHLTLVANEKVVLHREYESIRARQVTLLSGGGSGHEPAHAGYIGDGMLTGAICGNVFASPTTAQVLAAIRLVTGPKGCLVIVKNYTGDRLNFGLAVEQAKAEGLLVDLVVIGDDVAVVNANAGRRGLAGTVLVHKLAGAAAAEGADLASLVQLVKSTTSTDKLGTIGVALTACTLPGQSGPSRVLQENEMELGLGIHGEPGVEKCQLDDVQTLTKKMVDRLDKALLLQGNSSPAKIVLVVNNLGTTTSMELYVVAKYAVEALKCRGVLVERVLVGSFVTALDMSGFSLTAWKLENADASMLLHYVDAPTTATGWTYTPSTSTAPQLVQAPPAAQATAVISDQRSSFKLSASSAQLVERCIRAACTSLIEREPDLTQWDAKVGDGDCGMTFKNAAQTILADMATTYALDDPVALLRALAASVSKGAGGTSGVLYTIMLTAAAVEMEKTSGQWLASFQAGIDTVQRYGGAREGARTMLDALLPAGRAAKEQQGKTGSVDLEAIARAAEDGATRTRSIPTSLAFGRTGYVSEASGVDVPDPGAMAASIWIRAVVQTLQHE